MGEWTRKYLAELIGTAALVLFGCGSVAIVGYLSATPVGTLPVALAFGLVLTAMVYGIGPISGCHVNPAVTVSMWAAGRMEPNHAIGYIISQIVGGIAGALILVVILKSKLAGYDIAANGLGHNGWGEGYGGGFSIVGAIITELVTTFLFTLVILAVTHHAGTSAVAGLAIGLTLAVIHIVFIPVTGVSVNPARSLGPAIFVGGQAIAQVWLFLIVPTIGGALAGWLFKAKIVSAD